MVLKILVLIYGFILYLTVLSGQRNLLSSKIYCIIPFCCSLGVVDFVKAGYYMRRAWKMYEKCHNEINKPNRLLNGVSNDKKGTPKKVTVVA